jgi:hypothetical protein
VFFKNGPFAWNGFIVWGIGVAIFLIWILATAYLVIAAAARERDESPQLTAVSPSGRA